MSTHLLPHPKSEADAEREFLKVMGDPRRTVRYLAPCIPLLLTALVVTSVGWYRADHRPIEIGIIRVNEIGQPQYTDTSLAGSLHEPEVKYFIGQFIADYYGKNRQTIQKDFARALMFINSPKATQLLQEDLKGNITGKFIQSSDDEVSVSISNIILGPLDKAPYSAQVAMEKIFHDMSGTETRREKWVISITFVITPAVSNELKLINPLGFTIMSIREDQAFASHG